MPGLNYEPSTATRLCGFCTPFNHHLTTGAGDVIKLQPPRFEFRLRVGDYRVIFLRLVPAGTEVLHVRHRSEAYR